MKTEKFLLGALAGITVGAVLGILFAPGKGSKTRKKITKKGENLVDSLKDRLNEIIDTFTQKLEDVKEEILDFTTQKDSKAEESRKI